MPLILVAFLKYVAKEAVVTILENPDVIDEELMTVFTRTEALINSRPLTYQSANPQDDAYQDDTYLSICFTDD